MTLPGQVSRAPLRQRLAALAPALVTVLVLVLAAVHLVLRAPGERALLVLLLGLGLGLGASLSVIWWLQRSSKPRAAPNSEQRAQVLVDHTPSAIAVIDASNGTFIDVNLHTEAIVGSTRDSLLGRTPADFSPATQPDGRCSLESSQEYLRRAISGENPVFEWTIKHSDGTSRLTQIHLARLPPESSGLICASIVDISERQRAELELRRSEEKYRSLVNAIQDGVFIIQNGKLVFVNGPFAQMIGHEVDELIDQQFLRFVAPEDRSMIVDRYRRRLAGDDVVPEYEFRLIHRDGRTRVYVHMSVTLTELRGTRATMGTLKDFTERRAAQELLQASERRYRLLFERNLAGVYRAHSDGRLIDCNSAFAQMLGYSSADEAISRWRLDDHRSDSDQFLSTLDAGTEVRDHEATLQRDDGSLVHVLENAIWVIEDAREPPTILGTVIDITERRRIEGELHQAQKLQAIGRLAGGVAHDFSNLLQAILSTTETLSMDISSSDAARLAVSELRADVERGYHLTRQLLLFARRGSSELTSIDLNESIQSSLKLLQRLIRDSVRLDVVPFDGPLPVRADHGQLEQVLVNLVLNASDAMREGGVITIRPGSSSTDAWIDVADTGPGIPEVMRSRVFEPFVTSKGSNEGTGLGLSVAHGIMARHGGSLAILETSPQGTTFRVSLPRTDTIVERPSSDSTCEPLLPGRGERILLVEDEPATRAGIERLLVSLGFQVTAAPSAEEALSTPTQPGHDLLLTDMLLPGMDGLTLAEQLCERWPELPVVLMSGYSQTEPPAEIPFLPKPFTTSQLAETLRAALAGPPPPGDG